MMRQNGNKNMKYVNDLINKSNDIITGSVLKQESNNLKRKQIFVEEVKKIKKKYWDKYGVNKFYKEGQVLNQKYLSTSDFEEMEAQGLKNKKNFLSSKSAPDLLNK